jgi:hypothetical protein
MSSAPTSPPMGHTPTMPYPTEAHLRTAVQALAYLLAFNSVTKQPSAFDADREAALACIRDNMALIAAAPALLSALHECEAYLADREDVVDGDYGEPAPNKEMALLVEVRAAIKAAAGAP